MSTDLLARIQGRGYWQVVLRPTVFEAERLRSLVECEAVISQHQVRLRGWYFPFFLAERRMRGADYIEMEADSGYIKESWRFYQSALLVFYRGLTEDWIDDNKHAEDSLRNMVGEGGGLSILSALYSLSEAYEFAARLGQAGILGDELVLEITLNGTDGRTLFFWPGDDRLLWEKHVCNSPALSKPLRESVPGFVGLSRELSLRHFEWILERFGFDVPPDSFKGDQDKLFARRL